MNEAQFQRVKAAAKAQHAKGVAVVSGGYHILKEYGGKWRPTPMANLCACPLGCLVVETNPESVELGEAVSAALEEPYPKWRPFTDGFDGTGPSSELRTGIDDPWYVAGARMREELKAEGVMS